MSSVATVKMILSGFSGNNQQHFSVLSAPARLASVERPFISLSSFGKISRHWKKEIV
jgi:hypothetical protein